MSYFGYHYANGASASARIDLDWGNLWLRGLAQRPRWDSWRAGPLRGGADERRQRQRHQDPLPGQGRLGDCLDPRARLRRRGGHPPPGKIGDFRAAGQETRTFRRPELSFLRIFSLSGFQRRPLADDLPTPLPSQLAELPVGVDRDRVADELEHGRSDFRSARAQELAQSMPSGSILFEEGVDLLDAIREDPRFLPVSLSRRPRDRSDEDLGFEALLELIDEDLEGPRERITRQPPCLRLRILWRRSSDGLPEEDVPEGVGHCRTSSGVLPLRSRR